MNLNNKVLSEVHTYAERAAAGIWLFAFVFLWARIIIVITDTMSIGMSRIDDILLGLIFSTAVILLVSLIVRTVRELFENQRYLILIRKVMMYFLAGLLVVMASYITFLARVIQINTQI